MNDHARLRALVASRDPAEVGTVASVLGAAGHEVTTAYRADAAVARLVEERPDVVVVDPELAEDRVGLLARIRACTDAPILVLADLQDEALVVAALDSGAVDVVGRPLRPMELLARVNAATRRAAPANSTIPTLDGLRVDMPRRTASVAGRALSLTPTEYDLLAAIVARRGDVVDHRLLLRAGWRDPSDVDPETLRSHLNRLNAKLIAAGHPGLRNVRARGYALRVEGSRLAGD